MDIWSPPVKFLAPRKENESPPVVSSGFRILLTNFRDSCLIQFHLTIHTKRFILNLRSKYCSTHCNLSRIHLHVNYVWLSFKCRTGLNVAHSVLYPGWFLKHLVVFSDFILKSMEKKRTNFSCPVVVSEIW